MKQIIAALAALALARVPEADACGAFIAKTDGLRFNDALQFVIVRDGTHTIMSVQNRYRGPTEEFALLVPVPAVLHEGDVKTLAPSVFDQLETSTAPNLYELVEHDPCDHREELDGMARGGAPGGPPSNGVTVESQFAVGEYDVAVLSATESTSLDKWLADNGYALPATLGKQLRPYIEEGSKFFVAKVDPKRLVMVDGKAVLSPLRFEYDAPELKLPIRLSAANSAGTQDAIVYALSKTMGFDAANRPNARIPTNLDITGEAASHFAEFYASLFQATIAPKPTTVVTEYAGDAPYGLAPATLEALGAPALPNYARWQLSRLHFQIRSGGPLDDLVLEQVPAGSLFAAAYSHKARWTKPLSCSDPKFGRWDNAAGNVARRATRDTKPSSSPLNKLVETDVPALGITADPLPPPPTARKGCGCESSNDASGAVVLGVLALVAGRRRR